MRFIDITSKATTKEEFRNSRPEVRTMFSTNFVSGIDEMPVTDKITAVCNPQGASHLR